jgi:hypothetical protein
MPLPHSQRNTISPRPVPSTSLLHPLVRGKVRRSAPGDGETARRGRSGPAAGAVAASKERPGAGCSIFGVLSPKLTPKRRQMVRELELNH